MQKREILDTVYDIAVNNSAVSQTANQLANEFLEKYNRDVKKAAAEMINFQQTKCVDTDFLNNIGNKITVKALENTPEKSLKKINETIGYRLVMVLCNNGINVVPKAPVYESGMVEPFDRNSVKKVAERAIELFLQ